MNCDTLVINVSPNDAPKATIMKYRASVSTDFFVLVFCIVFAPEKMKNSAERITITIVRMLLNGKAGFPTILVVENGLMLITAVI